MERVKVQKEYKYILFDHYDIEKIAPIDFKFKKPLEKGKKFTLNDVTYKIIKVTKKSNEAIIRMIKYKIENTATTIVHKCPASLNFTKDLTNKKIKKLKDKHGERVIDNLLSGRVKMHSLKETKCPFCKVKFWKDAVEVPPEVQVVSRVKDRKVLLNRNTK